MSEQRLVRSMAELEVMEAVVVQAGGQLAHVEATVRSADRAVEVTVTARGGLTSVAFLDGKYLSMPAGWLAVSVLEAVREARARMARKAMAAFDVAVPAGSVTGSARIRRAEGTMLENAYFANPSVLRAGTRQIEGISQLANEMLDEFLGKVSATSGWPGRDDGFAKRMIPKERQGREGAVAACGEFVNAVVAVGDGTPANLHNVVGTQRGVLDSIHDSRGNTGGGDNGTRSGRH